MTDRELLELIAAQVGTLTKDVGTLTRDVGDLKKGQEDLKTTVVKLENKIEHEVSNKIQALFDGQKQAFEKLDRIEKEVAKHEEFILKRVK